MDVLRSLLAEELRSAFDMPAGDAEALAQRVMAPKREDEPLWFATERVASLVAVCRVTRHIPGVREWWATPESVRYFDAFVEWPGAAWGRINELYAAPAPDAFDPNWPDYKVQRVVEVPPNALAGDQFVLGDGEGSRFVLEVAEVEGELRATRGDSFYEAHEPFRSWQDQIEIELATLLRRQPGGQAWLQ